MSLPTETMEVQAQKIIDYLFDRGCTVSKEDYNFILSELSLSQNRIFEEVLKELPEEKIIHGYMKVQADGWTIEECEGWNEYRNAMIIKLI